MARLFCLFVLVTFVAATLAAPMREMSQKEAILKELLEDKKFLDWLYGDEETTDAITTTQPTTEAPQPLPIISLGEASRLTSNRICGAAQTLFPVRNEKVESKRDLVINMIYDICLPSVGIEDLEAFRKILDFLRNREEEDSADANVDAGTDTNADAGADAGADTNDNANVDAGADTNDNAGADADADAGADANADAGADAGADADTDADADAGADADADNGWW
eukprot:XP_003727812.1 PREDICTED: uncharacterized protein LOC100892260 [Strongylocentrotus purpuratus]